MCIFIILCVFPLGLYTLVTVNKFIAIKPVHYLQNKKLRLFFNENRIDKHLSFLFSVLLLIWKTFKEYYTYNYQIICVIYFS